VFDPLAVGLALCTAFVAAVLFLNPGSGRRWPWWVAGGVVLWLAVQAILGWTGFYHTDAPPPRPMLLLFPPLVVIAGALLIPRSREWLKGLPLRPLVWIHAVRVAVELVLWGAAERGVIPRAMTFEGTNFDILTGLTAPVIAVVGFQNGQPRRWVLIAWHLTGIGLLANVVTTAVLSMPTPFQRLNFDRPCVGVFDFPFTWLPAFVVPAVLFAHLVSLTQLFPRKNTDRPTVPAAEVAVAGGSVG